MTYHEAIPQGIPQDPLGHDHPAEWVRCFYCHKPFTRPIGSGTAVCASLDCNLEFDRWERKHTMAPHELDAYYRAAEAYFTRPEASRDTPAPLQAPRGLAAMSKREQERQSLARAQRELDELEERERSK